MLWSTIVNLALCLSIWPTWGRSFERAYIDIGKSYAYIVYLGISGSFHFAYMQIVPISCLYLAYLRSPQGGCLNDAYILPKYSLTLRHHFILAILGIQCPNLTWICNRSSKIYFLENWQIWGVWGLNFQGSNTGQMWQNDIFCTFGPFCYLKL